MKLLEPIKEKENNTKIFTLFTKFKNESKNENNKKYILSTESLYSSEELLD